jgi:hypothetical protein
MTSITTALVFVLHTILPKTSQERLSVVAEDIVSVVDDETSNKLLKSTIKRDQAIAMIAAAVTHESGFSEKVENCKINGDGGKSIGLGQVMIGQNWEGHTRKEICSDRKLQLRLALHVIDRCWQRTPNGAAAFRCYTSGDSSKDSRTAKREYETYKKIKASLDEYKKIEAIKKSEENKDEVAS